MLILLLLPKAGPLLSMLSTPEKESLVASVSRPKVPRKLKFPSESEDEKEVKPDLKVDRRLRRPLKSALVKVHLRGGAPP